MRVVQRELPSAFVKLDTAVTDANTFLNVAVEQKRRLNHNILLARSMKRTAWQWEGRGASPTGDTRTFNPYVPGVVDVRSVPPIVSQRIFISQQTQRCVFYAACADPQSTSDYKLYPVISQVRAPRNINTAEVIDASLDASGGPYTPAFTYVTVPRPNTRQYGMVEYDFAVYAVLEDSTSGATDSALAISRATSTEIDVTTASINAATGAGDFMYFNDATIEARVILRRTDSGGTTTLETLVPWRSNAPTTSNTFYSRLAGEFAVHDMALIEAPVTDYGYIPETLVDIL